MDLSGTVVPFKEAAFLCLMPIPQKDRLFVITQFVLMLIYCYPFHLGHFQSFYKAGGALLFMGLGIGFVAMWQLRHSISPFPSPKSSAILIQGGIFRWIRHPIYTGILMVFSGYALVSGSSGKALVTILLWILFQFKARYEERLLLAKFQDYAKYMAKTGRFLPKLGK